MRGPPSIFVFTQSATLGYHAAASNQFQGLEFER